MEKARIMTITTEYMRYFCRRVMKDCTYEMEVWIKFNNIEVELRELLEELIEDQISEGKLEKGFKP